MKSEDERIDEILKRVLDIWKNDYPKSDGDNGLDMDAYFTRLDESEAEAKAKLKSLLREAYKQGYAKGGLDSLDMANKAAAKVVTDILAAEPAQLTMEKDND